MTYFISGVCGVGKTTLIPFLKEHLDSSRYCVVDFDSRGVPKDADHEWRKTEARHWLSEGGQLQNKNTELVVCGFVKPSDFEGQDTKRIFIIVLDADAETIRARLEGRYSKEGVFDPTMTVIGKPVTEFIEGNVWYSSKMREESKADRLPLIDTSAKSPAEVSEEVVRIIKDTK